MEEETIKPQKKTKRLFLSALVIFFILAAGTATGYFLSLKGGQKNLSSVESGEKIKKGAVIGVDNPQIFRDKAVGVIEVNDGSFTDEGTHKLIRPGGESQTVYLTSSVLDLNQLIGRKVEVWGETYAAQKAGWLMDVGKVKVLE